MSASSSNQKQGESQGHNRTSSSSSNKSTSQEQKRNSSSSSPYQSTTQAQSSSSGNITSDKNTSIEPPGKRLGNYNMATPEEEECVPLSSVFPDEMGTDMEIETTSK